MFYKWNTYEFRKIEPPEPTDYGTDLIRIRPAMYIGDTGNGGIWNMFLTVLDNSIDETMTTPCNEIIVTLHNETTVSIENNGPGIPVDAVPPYTKPLLEYLLTNMVYDYHYMDYQYKASLNSWASLSIVNYLSSSLTAEVCRDNSHYKMEFKRGIPVDGLKIIGNSSINGTTITFTPDQDIFKGEILYRPDDFYRYLFLSACLNPHLTIHFIDSINSRSVTYHFPSGISKLLELIDITKLKSNIYSIEQALTIEAISRHSDKQLTPNNHIVYSSAEQDGFSVEIALKYMECVKKVFIFANSARVDRVACVKLENAIQGDSYMTAYSSFPPIKAIKNFCLVVSLKVTDPEFVGPTNTYLVATPKQIALVGQLTIDVMAEFCERFPNLPIQDLQRRIHHKRIE